MGAPTDRCAKPECGWERQDHWAEECHAFVEPTEAAPDEAEAIATVSSRDEPSTEAKRRAAGLAFVLGLFDDDAVTMIALAIDCAFEDAQAAGRKAAFGEAEALALAVTNCTTRGSCLACKAADAIACCARGDK